MNKIQTPVTVIGLGPMGYALAHAFLKAGHPTTVWNRTPAKADQLVADGAELAPSVSAAVKPGSLTIICITDYQAVRDLLETDAVELFDTTLINLTSSDSAEARETAAWAEKRGAHYVDGAIMAIPASIGTPEAVVLYSGPKQHVERHQAALDAVGTATYLGADHGLASVYDVAGLAMMWGILNAWLQGVALVRAAGVDAATFTSFVQQVAQEPIGWLDAYAQQVDSAHYPAEDAVLATHARSMQHLVEESEAVGINSELPRLFQAMADRAIAAGHGGESYAAMVHQFSNESAPVIAEDTDLERSTTTSPDGSSNLPT